MPLGMDGPKYRTIKMYEIFSEREAYIPMTENDK
jgi:hypothetical protein